MKRMGVVTCGGDAPGMNAAIRAVVRTALSRNCGVFGIRRGYSGLLSGDLERLTDRDVGGIIQRGGTVLGSARCPEFKTEEGRLAALRVLSQHRIEGLVAIGGNGTQAGAHALSQMGFPVAGVGATNDNDFAGTEIVIPDVETDPETVAAGLHTACERGKAHAIVVVAEGAHWNAERLALYFQQHRDRLGFDIRATTLGHVQRGGAPAPSIGFWARGWVQRPQSTCSTASMTCWWVYSMESPLPCPWLKSWRVRSRWTYVCSIWRTDYPDDLRRGHSVSWWRRSTRRPNYSSRAIR